MGSSAHWAAVLTIVAVTYVLRLGGLLLGPRLPSDGPAAAAMDRLPGFVLVSLVAPAILALGWLGVAGAVAAAASWRLFNRNLLAAIAAGAAAVALGRLL